MTRGQEFPSGRLLESRGFFKDRYFESGSSLRARSLHFSGIPRTACNFSLDYPAIRSDALHLFVNNKWVFGIRKATFKTLPESFCSKYKGICILCILKSFKI